MKLKPSIAIKALAVSCVLQLAACGGGGGSSGTASAPPASSAEGLWSGSTSASRSVTAFVLDDGRYWILYSIPHASSLMAGVVQGTGSSVNGSFSSSDGIDFNLEGQGTNSATVSASYLVRQSLNGSVSYAGLNQAYTFTSTFNTDYDQTPSVSAIAATYVGVASVAGKDELTTIVVSSPGVLAGTGTGGCKFLGTIAPRARGNVYDLSLVFGGGACTSGTSTVKGIGFYDASARRFYVAALNNARDNGLIFAGIKS